MASLEECAAGHECLLIQACAPPEPRSSLNGLRFLQRLRREERSLAPALVYSFLSRETLAARFSIVQEGVPGVTFLRAPFTIEEFRKALEGLKPITEEELRHVLRWHCGLQEDWKRLDHTLTHCPDDWPARREQAKSLVGSIEQDVRKMADDQVPALEALLKALNGDDPEPLRQALAALQTGLCRQPYERMEDLPEAPAATAPPGFDSILIADDKGYDPAATERLRAMNYQVLPSDNLARAREQLRRFLPAVVLADLHFPRAADGLALIEAAQAAAPALLVIAVSRAAPETALPKGVEDCCGLDRCADTDRIHRIIWKHALAAGVKPNG